MKIHEIVNPSLIKEGMVEPNVLLSIQNIIKNGKSTNLFELICVARLLQMLKAGTFYKQTNPFEVNMSTDKGVLDVLRALPAKDLVKVAEQLLQVLQVKDADSYYFLANPAQEFATWLKLITSREAND